MFSFRQKLFFAYVGAFLLAILASLPLARHIVTNIIFSNVHIRVEEIVDRLYGATSDEELVQKLRDEFSSTFFRVAVINDQRQTLYDSHKQQKLGEAFDPERVRIHPEVEEAFEAGRGIYIDWSETFERELAYVAVVFDFQGKKYVLRTAFPLNYIADLSNNVEQGLLTMLVAVLVLFSAISWLMVNYLMRPVQQIISEIRPYQEGKEEAIPTIHLYGVEEHDEFYRLAETLNSLTARVRSQIDQLTKERNERAAILATLIEGVVAVGSDMRVIYANAASRRFLSLGNEEIVGRDFAELGNDRCYQLLEECQTHGRVCKETLIEKTAGKKTYLDVVAAPHRPAGAVLVIQDQTSSRRLLEMRKNFVANASHELKTPITIIQGFVETLEKAKQLSDEQLHTVIQKIIRNCERMTSAIHDLLTLSDIENLPASQIELCDLRKIGDLCAERVREAHPDAEIVVHVPGIKPQCMGHPRLLELAIWNLMENGAKYSNFAPRIDVRIEEEEKEVKISVSDQGIGIAPEHLEHIFQRFYTADKTKARKLGGVGLGLSIVETIVDKHRGTIQVKSEVDVGTTFIITLPKDGHQESESAGF